MSGVKIIDFNLPICDIPVTPTRLHWFRSQQRVVLMFRLAWIVSFMLSVFPLDAQKYLESGIGTRSVIWSTTSSVLPGIRGQSPDARQKK